MGREEEEEEEEEREEEREKKCQRDSSQHIDPSRMKINEGILSVDRWPSQYN